MKIDVMLKDEHTAHCTREEHHHQSKANKLARLVRQAGTSCAG